MTPYQPCLPGLESLRRPKWNPIAFILAKVKSYFMGYHVNGKPIKCRMKHAAKQIGIGVRTLFRYIAYLVAEGWMQTVKRRPRHAVRELNPSQETNPVQPAKNQDYNPPRGTSPGTCIEVNSESLPTMSFNPTSSCGDDFQEAVLRTWRKFMPPPVVLFRRVGRAKDKFSDSFKAWLQDEEAK